MRESYDRYMYRKYKEHRKEVEKRKDEIRARTSRLGLQRPEVRNKDDG